MTIGQVSAESGISASAIRYYESLGILPKPARKNGKRLYDDAVLQRLAVVRFYRTTGVSIRHIAQMFAADARSENETALPSGLTEWGGNRNVRPRRSRSRAAGAMAHATALSATGSESERPR